MTKASLDVGMAGREAVQEAFGLEGEAFGSIEQAADVFGSFFPIPISALGSGAGKLSKIGLQAAAIATPLVRSTTFPGHIQRGAAQMGAFGGIEQGLRALVDHPDLPLMFSEEALAGAKPKLDLLTRAPYGEESIHQQEIDEARLLDQQVQEQEDKNRDWAIAGLASVALAALGGAKYLKHRNKNRYLPIAEGGELAAGRPQRSRKTYKDQVMDRLDKTRGTLFDSTHDIERAIAEADIFSPQAMSIANKNMVSILKNTDTRGVAAEMSAGNWPGMRTVELPKGVNFSGTSLDDLSIEVQKLSSTQKVEFVEAMASIYHVQTLQRNQEAIGLLDRVTNKSMTVERAHEIIDHAATDPEIYKLILKYGDIGQDALIYQRYVTDTLTQDMFNKFASQAKVPGRFGDKPIYIHGVESDDLPKFLNSLAYKLGRDSHTGETLRDMAFNLSRSATEGVKQPLDPFASMRIYLNVMSHATTEAQLQRIVLTHGSGIRGLGFGVVKGTDKPTITRVTADGETIPLESADRLMKGNIAGGPTLPPDNSPIRLMGVWNPDELVPLGDIMHPKWYGVGDPIARKLTGYSDSMLAKSLRATIHSNDQTMIVPIKGKDFLFYVEPHLKRVLEMNPELAGSMRFGSFFKGMFQQTVTGVLSVFLPAAAAYNAQLAAMTRSARYSKIHPETGAIKGMAKGSWEASYDTLMGIHAVFKADASKIWSDWAARSMARHISEGREAPEILRGLQDRLSRTMNNQTLNAIRATQGKSATGVMSYATVNPSRAFDGLMSDGLSKVTQSMGADFAISLGRTWSGLHRAFHEGTFVGAVIREANRKRGRDPITGKFQTKSLFDSPNEFNEILLRTKKDVGDVSRYGSGQVARFAHHWVPFSAPTLQSWAAIGSAIKSVGIPKGTAIVAGVVGVPTAIEFLSNQMMMLADTDKNGELKQYWNGKRYWTQVDYFWNGYGEQARVNNSIYMIPGVAPWRSVLINIAPEWSLGRAIVMDTLDLFGGFSNVGNKGKVMREQGHIWAGLTRVFEIPMPPAVAAIISGVIGVDFRLGVHETITTDDGKTASITTSRPIGRAGRTTSSQGRYAESFHSERFAKVVENLWGSLATAYLAMTDGFFPSYKEDDIVGGLENAWDALGEQASERLRMGQPLWGKSHRNTRSNSINKDLYAKMAVLNDLSRNEYNVIMGKGILDWADGSPLRAPTMPPPDDPIYTELARSSRDILKAIEPIQDAVNSLQKRTIREGNDPRLSIAERLSLRDQLANEINAQRAVQLSILEKWEDGMSELLTQRLGRKVDVDFSKIKARRRPNIGEKNFTGRPMTRHPHFNR
jgi:hypothetical protein